MDQQADHTRSRMRSHTAVALLCAGIGVGMLGMAYAAVPLYQMFCQVTGFGGTTQRAEAPSDHTIDRNIIMRFDANISRQLNWQFRPTQPTLQLQLGENRIAHYTATNTGDQPSWGTATFNVSPESAGVYFNKIECFCFTEQRLDPGQTADMPVSFFIDPDIVNDRNAGHLSEITLSYTFYPLDKAGGASEKDANESANRKATTIKDAT